MASFLTLTTAQLKEAVQIRERIEALQAKLDALLGNREPKAMSGAPTAKRTKDAARREKVGAAPAWHLAHVRSPLDTLFDAAPKKKGAITPEGRAKLSAAMKARWAARKKGEPTLNAPAK